MKPQRVVVNDKMQKNYSYLRTVPAGRNYPPEFRPELTPKQMLALGIFGGKRTTPVDQVQGQARFLKIRGPSHAAKSGLFDG